MTEYPYFDEMHEKIQEIAEDVAEKFKATAVRADETGDYEIVEENLKRLGELELLGLPIPQNYGGPNRGMRSYVRVAEEIAKACVSTAFALNSQLMCIQCILLAGNEEQKAQYFPSLTEEKIGAFAATEPEAGSDLASLQTTAEKKGEKYILNGKKHYITNGAIADTFIVFAKTAPSKGAKGISAFIVDSATPGIEIGKVEEKMGVKAAPTSEIFFDAVEIPKENRLGEEGEGFKIALQGLNYGRTGISAICVGVSKIALEKAVNFARQREQFGKPIAKKQAVRFKIADMATNIKAMENLTYHTAWLADRGERISKAAAIAKKFNAEKALDITKDTLQIYGGAGYTKEYPVERFYRDVRAMSIVDGTSEIMNVIIARHTIGRLSD